jgi:hypothetical protein
VGFAFVYNNATTKLAVFIGTYTADIATGFV